MLMSKSRLEKFLYALYSLDSSDLPNPLSRIEELYKCLVTGEEAPSFEPISRVEKYLMAILGGYDVDSLPNPLSRVEVLLYKLATGDDNLDDVKSFLSEHEELLAEIIKNGGFGGNIDIEYVLYTLSTEFNTLYNTAKKPVKSAILSGNTLVNIVDFNHIEPVAGATISDKVVTLDKSKTNSRIEFKTTHPSLVANKQYTVVLCDVNGDVSTLSACVQTNSSVAIKTPFINNKAVVTMDEGNNKRLFYIESSKIVADTTVSFKFMVIEGNYTNADIPYFEGMQSVKLPVLKTTGKNLFDGELEDGAYHHLTGNPVDVNGEKRSKYPIRVNGNDKYYFSSDSTTGNVRYYMYDENMNFIATDIFFAKDGVITTVANTVYVHFRIVESDNVNIQIEHGAQATSYKPYKSNILTTNEEVTLRAIGDVKDELNLITGELTQRIGEIVLDGSEGWILSTSKDNTQVFNLPATDSKLKKVKTKGLIMCDKLKATSGVDEEVINFTSSLYIALLKSKASTVEELKVYLSQNPITFIHELKKESVKTVDLSIVDQDGNDTKLSTFNDITHVTLSSEGLIPEAELEVATKNEEDLGDSIVYTVHTLSEEHNTLYNTAEKPVKSAILKGNTLVNLFNVDDSLSVEPLNSRWKYQNQVTNLIGGNKYYVYFFNKLNNLPLHIKPLNTEGEKDAFNVEANTGKVVTLDSTVTTAFGYYYFKDGWTREESKQDIIDKCKILFFEYQEGMENWDIPYFEGMKSVQMPVLKTVGKNTFNIKNKGAWRSGWYSIPLEIPFNGEVYVKCADSLPSDFRINLLAINRNEHVLTNEEIKKGHTAYYQNLTDIEFHCPSLSIEGDSRGILDDLVANGDIVIDVGGEPHKSNILTTSEEVTLRGIGKVRDELDLLTGKVTQRIGEVVLDGSENWKVEATKEKTHVFVYMSDIRMKGYNTLISDKFVIGGQEDTEKIVANEKGAVYIAIDKTKVDTISTFKTWLANNNVLVQYLLAEESVKTVDLSVVDQDGNDTKLSTFNDITHVTLSSEGLIPKAELEVGEKVPEVAASMLTISREQEVIDTTTNEQSENVDATMIAATEIYEELL